MSDNGNIKRINEIRAKIKRHENPVEQLKNIEAEKRLMRIIMSNGITYLDNLTEEESKAGVRLAKAGRLQYDSDDGGFYSLPDVE